jgi:2-keto-4-pentenoate hydratase
MATSHRVEACYLVMFGSLTPAVPLEHGTTGVADFAALGSAEATAR